MVPVDFLGATTTLHRVWDAELLVLSGRSPVEWAQLLEESVTESQAAELLDSGFDPLTWANESLTITREIYARLPQDGLLGTEHVAWARPVVESRVVAAGLRLAQLIESAAQ